MDTNREPCIGNFETPGISFNIVSGRITIFKTTLKIMGYPEFFHFMFSSEDRMFGIEPGHGGQCTNVVQFRAN